MLGADLRIEEGRINFVCKRENCTHNCCGPFDGITSELSSFDKRPFNEIVLTKNDYRLLNKNGASQLVEIGFSPQMNKSYYKMSLEQNGTCKAFKNGRCSVHRFRPTLCRAFPFYFDMFSGLCAIKCEGFSNECWADIENYETCFAAARKMYEFWLDFYTSDKENL